MGSRTAQGVARVRRELTEVTAGREVVMKVPPNSKRAERWEVTAEICFVSLSEARRQGFTPVSSPPSLVNGSSQQNTAKLNAFENSNSVKCSSWAVTSFHVAHSMLHVTRARCVAHDLQTIVPCPLERTCWRQFAAQWGGVENLEWPLSMRLLLLL